MCSRDGERVTRMPPTTGPMVHPARVRFVLPILAISAACGGAEPEGPIVEGDPIGVVGAHEHGVARLALTVEGTDVFLALEAPGDALFGFERAPRTEEEVALVTERVSGLEVGLATAVVMPAELGCRATGPVRLSGVPEPELVAATDEDDDHGHDHEDDHGHDHEDEQEPDHEEGQEEGHDHEEGEEHDDDAHMEVTADVTLTCDVAPAGYEAQLAFGPLLPAAEQIDLTVVTDVGEAAARVAADARFTF